MLNYRTAGNKMRITEIIITTDFKTSSVPASKQKFYPLFNINICVCVCVCVDL